MSAPMAIESPDRSSMAFLGVPVAMCAGCGKPFQPVRRTQSHCRPRCRRLTFERKHAAERRPPWQLFE